MNASLKEQLRSDLHRVGAQVGQPTPDHLGLLTAEIDRRGGLKEGEVLEV